MEEIFARHGFPDYKRISPKDIIVSEWVRMKCRFGCPDFGKLRSCPPFLPELPECRAFFSNYHEAALIRLAPPKIQKGEVGEWMNQVHQGLVALEKDVFLAGNEKAFALLPDSCRLCEKCTNTKAGCARPELVRPVLEGMGVDVYGTVRKAGYPVRVLNEEDSVSDMNRYAMLMLH